MAHQLGVVALDADARAGLGEQGRVIGDGVVGLDLVGPPVGEGRRAGAVGSDLGGDLVAFQDVLERLDPHAVLLGRAQEHQDLVAAIAVAVDLDRAVEDAGQGFQPQVDARRRAEPGCVGRLVSRPSCIRPRWRDRPGPSSKARSITDSTPMRVLGNRPRGAGDVFAQRELHPLRAVADDQVAARPCRSWSLTTASWPPIVLAEPWSSRAVVVPPASAR